MNSCSNHITNAVVVYDEKECPLCWSEAKISDLEQEAGGLDEEVNDLKELIKDFEKKIDSLENGGGS